MFTTTNYALGACTRALLWHLHTGRCKAVILWVLALSIAGCQSKVTEQQAAHKRDTALEEVQKPLYVRHAQGFRLDFYEGCTAVRVQDPFQANAPTLCYLVLDEAANIPPEFQDCTIIRKPVRRIVATTTTHVALLDFVDGLETVKGTASASYISNPTIRHGLKEGTVKVVGHETEIDLEAVIALKPDVLLISGMNTAQLNRYRVLRESGIAVMAVTEWMERSPLGRMEWVKMLAVVLGKEGTCRRRFKAVVQKYRQLEALAATSAEKPKVITATPFKGTWHMPGGNSFVGNLLKDAHATWPWHADTSAVSLPLDFESVYPEGLQADFWLMPGVAKSKQEILQMDTRFEAFKPFRENRIYNSDKRTNASGTGMEYWETGVTNPHVVLADLISILHPDLPLEHERYYFRKLE